MQDLIKREDLDIVKSDMQYLKKDMSEYVSQSEVLTRIGNLNADIVGKINDRPTI